jgi:hypothetical protein
VSAQKKLLRSLSTQIVAPFDTLSPHSGILDYLCAFVMPISLLILGLFLSIGLAIKDNGTWTGYYLIIVA